MKQGYLGRSSLAFLIATSFYLSSSVVENVNAQTAYITNYTDSTVNVINVVTHKVVGTIKVGTSPNGVSVSPDGSKVYIANADIYTNNSVSVINTATNTVSATIETGNLVFAHGLCVTPDGSKVYVAELWGNSVIVVNTATNTVSATITVGNEPYGVSVSPDGSKVYVTNCWDNSVSVINTATNTVSATIAVVDDPYGITVTPDGSKAYVANYDAHCVSVINTSTDTILTTVPVGSCPYGISVSPDGSSIYVTNLGSNTVNVINTATNDISATITVGVHPYGVSVSPDGSEVYVANSGDNTISVINTATNNVVDTIKVGNAPIAFGNFISPYVSSCTSIIRASRSASFCTGESLTLTANICNSYMWSTGATTRSIVVSASGNYYCIGHMNCGIDTSNTITVTVLSSLPPSASITATGPTIFCSGDSVVLNANTDSGIRYQWNNGTNIPGATGSSFTAKASGNYVCILTDTNNCSSTSNILSVAVNPLPTASISTGGWPIDFCSGGSVTLNADTSNGLSYQWINGVNVPGATALSYRATTSGNYACVVTDRNNCSAISNIITVTVHPTIQISVSTNSPVCAGDTLQLLTTANSLACDAWNGPGDIQYVFCSLDAYVPNVTDTNAGIYHLIIRDRQYGCDTSTSVSVIVVDPPHDSIIATGASTFCTGQYVILNAVIGNELTYQWQDGGINILGATFSSYIADTSGNYQCVVSNSCGNDTSNTVNVTLLSSLPPSAIITATGPTIFCWGDSVALNANMGNGTMYQWSNGTNISGATSPSYTAKVSGNYVCIVTDTNNCSSISNIIFVTVNHLPTASISTGGLTDLCSGDSLTLNAHTSNVLTYQWQNGGINIPKATVSSYTADTAGNYQCIVSNSCGVDTTNSITVTINSLPTASISAGGTTTFCLGDSVTLIANIGIGLTYQWQNGKIIPNATSSSYSATAGGNYTCIITNYCGSDTSNIIRVSLNPSPTASFSLYPDTSLQHHYIAINNSTGLSPLGYIWSWGDGTNDTIPYPSHTYADSGFYTICLTVTDSNGCTNTFCDSSFHIMRTTDYMVYINVIPPLILGTDAIQSQTQRLIIYPNPAHTLLTVQSSAFNAGATTVTVMDLLGQDVSATLISTTLNDRGSLSVVEVNISTLSPGIYFLKVENEKGRWVGRFVKE